LVNVVVTASEGWNAAFCKRTCDEADITTNAIIVTQEHAALSGIISLVRKWRAAADEDGHYSFAVAL
jgi:hypothetical protein